MKGYMYILRCVDNSYYTGSTKDMERRFLQHQQGLGARHTARRLPVELVYVEVFERINEAFLREEQVQGWSRKKKEALMLGDVNRLHEFAACQNESHYGFGSTQPEENVGFGFAQPTGAPESVDSGTIRSLSGVEGNEGTV